MATDEARFGGDSARRLPWRMRMSSEEHAKLVAAARGDVMADLLLEGGRYLNVFTGELLTGSIAIAAGRVAWVGDRRGSAIETIDLEGATVVPGLIEPHSHADVMYTPPAVAEAIVRHGTTTVCADTLFTSLLGTDDETFGLLQELNRSSPVKFLWNLRNAMDGIAPEEVDRLGPDRMDHLRIHLDGVVASGETTAWPRLVHGDERLSRFLEEMVADRFRIDGHAAGASRRTLETLSAVGITADHEAISADELTTRLDVGLWVMLRHSSLRPDGTELAAALRNLRFSDRVMLTTDGPVASDVVHGHLDRLVRILIAEGTEPALAVRMASLHPATYLGLDAHVGSVAAGRCADLLIVDDLQTFVPTAVFVDGSPVSSDESSSSLHDLMARWSSVRGEPFRSGRLSAERLEVECRDGTWMRLEGIITRAVERPPDTRLPEDASYLALVNRSGDSLVAGAVVGLRVDALASTFGAQSGVLLLGRDPQEMLRCYEAVTQAAGGIATSERLVPLPVGGRLHSGAVPAVARDIEGIAHDLGLSASMPPIEYLLLFLSTGVLPDVRLTDAGAVNVKTGTVTAPVIHL